MKKKYYKNHLVKKKFSQNFLDDINIINKIIYFINPKKNQAMVEIGPGLGALTKKVIIATKYMTAIEIDKKLVSRLKKKIFNSKLNILQKDVMKVDFAKISISLGEPLRLFGNLPYNISTKLIFYLLKYIKYIKDMHFMLQKDLVNRLIAIPNNKNFGRLSIMVQYYCKVTSIIDVPSFYFKPRPNVDSAFVKLVPYYKVPFIVKDIKKLEKITKLAFNKRRKILRNSLCKIFTEKQLKEQGINYMLRAENISLENYCRLANIIS